MQLNRGETLARSPKLEVRWWRCEEGCAKVFANAATSSGQMEDEAGEESRCLHLTALRHLHASSFSTDVVDCNGGVAPLPARLRLSQPPLHFLSILHGRLPDATTRSIVFSCLAKRRQPFSEESLVVLVQMAKMGFFPFQRLLVHSAHPQVVPWRRHLRGLAGKLQDGLSLLDRMKSSHACDPDSVTYTSLIDAFCKAAELDKAHELLTRMEKERVTANVVMLTTFVNGICRHGMMGCALNFSRKKKVEATALLDEMIKEGVSVDSATYFTLISGLTQVGKLDDAYLNVSFIEMVDYGCKPNVVTYGTLINGYCKAGDLDQAMKFFRSMDVSVLTTELVNLVRKLYKKKKGFKKKDVRKVIQSKEAQPKVKFEVTCYGCNQKGHIKDNCLNQKDAKKSRRKKALKATWDKSSSEESDGEELKQTSFLVMMARDQINDSEREDKSEAESERSHGSVSISEGPIPSSLLKEVTSLKEVTNFKSLIDLVQTGTSTQVQKLEEENSSLKSQVKDLKLTLERFTLGSKNLDLILGNQKVVYN
ncbi:hypothetical protein ZIOFF_009348 [Zingiber officinale]|uniref:CCHC-type domain-containing protein n=1 Tax=Zingiber officinale TaxID=94328 RepID=A0A8J5LRE4_ZINOF|nr:hypothetical protein ZIOFF_009348 [Zingiber officinale]